MPNRFDREAQEAFLDEYYDNGGYGKPAAEAVGFYLSTIQYHAKHNARFARALKDVDEQLGEERASQAEIAIEEVRTKAVTNHGQYRGKTHNRNWKPTFLRCLRINGCVTHAAHAAGIHPRTAYNAKQQDEEFALEWYDAIESSTENLEAEGIRRALNISDLLLMFFLKARKPAVYRENAQIWKDSLDEQHMATIVDAVKNAAFTTGLATEEFEEFKEELANELRKFEKAA